jgi:hypothetical protein
MEPEELRLARAANEHRPKQDVFIGSKRSTPEPVNAPDAEPGRRIALYAGLIDSHPCCLRCPVLAEKSIGPKTAGNWHDTMTSLRIRSRLESAAG